MPVHILAMLQTVPVSEHECCIICKIVVVYFTAFRATNSGGESGEAGRNTTGRIPALD